MSRINARLGEAYLNIRARTGMLAGDLARGAAQVAAGMAAFSIVDHVRNAVAALGETFIQSNSQMERYQTSLGVLLGTEGRAVRMFDEIRKMASKTPFNIPGLTSATQQLLGVGVAAQEVLPMLRKLGDTAAASTEGLDALPRLVRAVSQMKGAGKINAQDMLQITSLSIPAWDILAKKMGKSVAQVRKMSESSQLTRKHIDLLIEAMGERFGGMMQKLSRTWAGLMETLKDSFTMTIQKISGPIFERLKDVLTHITDYLQTDEFSTWTDKIAGAVEKTVSYIVSAFQNPVVRNILEFTAAIIGAAALTAALSFLGTAAVAVGGFLAGAFSPIGAIILGAVAAYKMIADAIRGDEAQYKIMGENLTAIWKLAKEIFSNIARGISDLATFVVGKWNAMFGPGSPAGSWIAQTFNGLLIWIRNALDWISLLTTDWSKGWEYVKTFAGLKMLQLGDSLANTWDLLKAGFLGVVNSIVEAFLAMYDNIKTMFIEIGNLTSALGAGTVAAMNAISNGADAAADAFMNEFNKKLAGQEQGQMKSVSEAAAKGYQDAFKGSRNKNLEYESSATGAARRSLAKIEDDMRKTRQIKRHLDAMNKDEEKKKAKPEEYGKPEDRNETVPGKKMQIIGIAEMARHIQTAVGNTSPDQKIEKNTRDIAKDMKSQVLATKSVAKAVEGLNVGAAA